MCYLWAVYQTNKSTLSPILLSKTQDTVSPSYQRMNVHLSPKHITLSTKKNGKTDIVLIIDRYQGVNMDVRNMTLWWSAVMGHMVVNCKDLIHLFMLVCLECVTLLLCLN